MIEKISVKNEDDAWELLQKALANEISETAQVTFEGWPIFKLTIEGKDFAGSIPTRIMPPILDLQKEIHRIYCKAKYNTEETNKLRKEEREFLELVVSIKPGSTKFITDLFKALNEIIKNSDMSGTQILILVISIGTLLTTSVAWKDWLASNERKHGQEVTTKLSEQETKRLELVTQALTATPELRQNKTAIDNFKSDISKKLKPADQLIIGEDPIINGERAAEIVPSPKEVTIDVRLDGKYAINEVKFPTEYGGDYRFSVTRLKDDKSFMVDASPDALTPQQITILKDGGFEIKHVFMGINAKQHRSTVHSARLLSIEWPRDEKPK